MTVTLNSIYKLFHYIQLYCYDDIWVSHLKTIYFIIVFMFSSDGLGADRVHLVGCAASAHEARTVLQNYRLQRLLSAVH